jgi:hypothetical protein
LTAEVAELAVGFVGGVEEDFGHRDLLLSVIRCARGVNRHALNARTHGFQLPYSSSARRL